MEFFKNLSTEWLMVVACVLVVLFILGKLAISLLKRIIIGAIAGCIVSAILYYVFHLPIKTVGLIGIIVFIGGAIFGKVD